MLLVAVVAVAGQASAKNHHAKHRAHHKPVAAKACAMPSCPMTGGCDKGRKLTKADCPECDLPSCPVGSATKGN